jgi:hypothetical protein
MSMRSIRGGEAEATERGKAEREDQLNAVLLHAHLIASAKKRDDLELALVENAFPVLGQ